MAGGRGRRMFAGVRSFVFVLAVAAALAVAGPASAAWSPVTALAGSSGAGSPAVAVNARGDVAVAWASEQQNAPAATVVRVAVRRGPEGGFSTHTLQHRRNWAIGGLAIALDGRGETTVAWVERASTRGLLHGHIAIRSAFRTTSGRWSAVQRITYTSPFRHTFPRLAAAPGGRVLLAFNAGVKAAPGVAVARRRPGHAFGRIQSLNTGRRGYLFDLQAAFDKAGKGYLAGVRDCDTDHSAGVLFTAPTSVGRFTASRVVAPAPVRELHLALAGPGEGTLAWLATACSTTEYHAGPVQTAALRTGRVTAPTSITDAPGFEISLSLGPGGTAEAAWTASPPEAPGGGVRIARSDASGAFGSPFAPPAGLFAVAADAAGDQIVAIAKPSNTRFPDRIGIRTPDGTVAFAPLPSGRLFSIATVAPSGRGAAIATPTMARLRVATWRP